jgi:hypothetical protein
MALALTPRPSALNFLTEQGPKTSRLQEMLNASLANAFGVETRLHFSIAAATRSRLLASRNVESVSGRYFAAFFLLFASARRSVFLRRAARFLTLSLPWLFPIGLNTHPFFAASKLFRCVSVKNNLPQKRTPVYRSVGSAELHGSLDLTFNNATPRFMLHAPTFR